MEGRACCALAALLKAANRPGRAKWAWTPVTRRLCGAHLWVPRMIPRTHSKVLTLPRRRCPESKLWSVETLLRYGLGGGKGNREEGDPKFIWRTSVRSILGRDGSMRG